MLLLLEPVVEVAREPLIELPLEPVTGLLGATGALLGAVLPIELGRPLLSGVTGGIAVRPGGWTRGR
jgi:hypothetical protein